MREPPFTAVGATVLQDVVTRYQGPLYGFLRGLIADDEQARDLVQDTLCEAWLVILRGSAPFAGAWRDETASTALHPCGT